ncbi:hypothetical protein [Caulobacter endophyticus]|uniref:hypothetical protein n=1 Tax=Caulobacter endophyticus TaxID=2172652 RepID=UPI00130487CF|nr:hypothetical protein [Caulobacter endophyticus]
MGQLIWASIDVGDYACTVRVGITTTWHAIARVDQLKDKGGFVTADIVGEARLRP